MDFQRQDMDSTGDSPYGEEWLGADSTEAEVERWRRLYGTEEAAEQSKQIDRFLSDEKNALHKRKTGLKILLLGQSGSGKSSVLKNFQLHFAPNHFQKEQSLRKTIIYINVIESIKTIFTALEEEYEPKNGKQANNATMSLYQRMKLNLSPIMTVEANVLALLAPDSKEREMAIKAGSGWKSLLQTKQFPSSAGNSSAAFQIENDPSSILIAHRDDIQALWLDDEVQRILSSRRPLLRQSPGFFMDEVSRILTHDYAPTDYDISRTRMKTMGVEEHYFSMEKGKEAGMDCYIIDVGGSRSQRATWAPFFDDVNVIVFLAPLLFNEYLEEDRTVNRVEDSMLLWTEICGNKLLANAHIVLFFNKLDVLEATLKAGVQVKQYITSYSDRPNELTHALKYFKDKFRNVHQKYSPERRPFTCHETRTINVKCMDDIIHCVRTAALYQNLRSAGSV